MGGSTTFWQSHACLMCLRGGYLACQYKHFEGEKQSCARIINLHATIYISNNIYTPEPQLASLNGREGFQDRAHLSNFSTASNSKGTIKIIDFETVIYSLSKQTHRQTKHLFIRY